MSFSRLRTNTIYTVLTKKMKNKKVLTISRLHTQHLPTILPTMFHANFASVHMTLVNLLFAK